MHMSLPTLYRAALLHLTLNPLFIARASATAAAHLQSANRPFSTLLHQCPSALYQSQININQYSTSSTMASDSTPTEQQKQPEQQQQEEKQQEQLALPDASSSTNTLDLSSGSDAVKLDHLGPMVVNQDGTLARITNWEHMAEIEKKNTLRVIGKRNKQRLEALKAARAAEEKKE